jgi:tuftelin-interacting protein 11
MARRKANKGFLSDGDSTDGSGGDGDDFDSSFLPGGDDAEERALFEDPYSKKRKRGGKEDALYGVFADDDDEDEDVEGFGKGKGKAKGGGGPGGKRMDWTK